VKELVVCSGKGGTGKTSVLASLAALAEGVALADCDVDAANLHLVLQPVVRETHVFTAGHEAVIRAGDCLNCGICAEVCRYGAVTAPGLAGGDATHTIDPLRCEGCGVCVRFCPEDAIDFPERRSGFWFVSDTARGPMVHAALDPGGENSGKLVTRVREETRLVARAAGRSLILVDGPPGIGCPATAAITGADLVLLVTEPGLSALHDLSRIVDLADRLQVPAAVCLNRHDISPALTRRIEGFCTKRGIPLLGKIPFDPRVDDAQRRGTSLVEFAPDSRAARVLTDLWRTLADRLTGETLTRG
jgi:MinD superfamily P-loop ATPase